MEKLTKEQISDLKYFWEEKGDIERYCDFEKLKPQIQEQLPELLKAWYDYKASIKIMDAVVMRSFSLEEMKQAFKAGRETIWEDLEQTTRCAKFESFEEWFENYA